MENIEYTIKRAQIDAKIKNPGKISRFSKKASFTIKPINQADYQKYCNALNKYLEIRLIIVSSYPLDITIYPNIKTLSLINCNVKSIADANSKIKAIAYPIGQVLPVLEFKHLERLDISYSSVKHVPTIPSLKYLFAAHSALSSIAQQPNLVEMDVSDTLLKVLPQFDSLEYLYMSDTRIVAVSPMPKLKFLLAFDSTLYVLPRESCKNIQYCFVDALLIFEERPAKLREFYIKKENYYYHAANYKPICVEIDDAVLMPIEHYFNHVYASIFQAFQTLSSDLE